MLHPHLAVVFFAQNGPMVLGFDCEPARDKSRGLFSGTEAHSGRGGPLSLTLHVLLPLKAWDLGLPA